MNGIEKEYQITGHTKLTGLLGSPVSHSISPLMHNKAFQMLGLNYVYLCFDIKENQLKETLNGLSHLQIRGFNCTMPLKTKMFELADEVSKSASFIGAVNTVVFENGKFIGYNTDGIGYMMAVKEAGHSIIGKKMTLLGAGGAATAICAQAAIDGVKEIDVFNRKGPRFHQTAQFIQKLNRGTDCTVSLYDINDTTQLKKSIQSSAILTNGTSVGMAPNTEACPIPDSSFLHPELIISDAIYNPKETRLMKMGKKVGCPVMNGLYMLLFQGSEAFRLWTGMDMPVEIIKHDVIDQ
ncbi:shikimate dehydrogenase [Velocimicrobium porci]|uniref:Shikimate dehydrogenase (NADP(+)) n=1 Tax=Velocimicrobium porci TaxID=2606634 RepID=A0A6L5XXZ0_9FIRM|nr:shikimate dehydrogenase [Velocimicrobium porci]MSS63740.1 shikimate dehydrogenase [Velocimicrobium porci]